MWDKEIDLREFSRQSCMKISLVPKLHSPSVSTGCAEELEVGNIIHKEQDLDLHKENETMPAAEVL